MIKKILLGLLALIAVLCVVIALQPADFKISRSAKINAPPATVFAQVNDFHKWEAWSPWAKMDPNCKFSYEGPAAGVGATFRWEGNMEVGTGNMTITESKPADLILIRLEFLKPMQGVNTTEFTFKPDGAQTDVSWTMTGKNNFVGKAFSLFMDCDKMVGGQFEKGLASMKSIAETATKS